MKTLLLAIALVSLSGLASASECDGDKYQISHRTFTATTYAGRFDNSCDLRDAEALAEAKCKRAGYQQCRRLGGNRGVNVTDSGNGQVCSVTVSGQKFEGIRPECVGI